MAMVTPATATEPEKSYTYHYNGVGSTVAMTDASKNIANKYAYSPFGNVLAYTEQFPQPFKFVGKYGVTAETGGLYHMRARYYDPQVGRFISEDPIGFEGGDVNLYGYVGNNPIMGIDPSGLCGSSLDSVQLGLDVAGMVPVFGEPADLVNAGISAFRGNWAEAGLSVLAVVPVLGVGGTAGKAALKYSDDAAALIDLAKGAKRTGINADEAQTLLKWADEYNVKPALDHINTTHWEHGAHIRVGPVNHIPVR